MPALLAAEELEVGIPIDLGTYTVARLEIIDFAAQWDPQPFHIDEAAAATGDFGEVVASGVHTLAIYQRLAVAGAYRHWDIVAGRRIRDLEMTSPVRPDTTLHGSVVVDSVEPTHPERALVTLTGALRHDVVTVMTAHIDVYVRRVRQ